MSETGRSFFTDEMKKTYTILIPNMLPVHFSLLTKAFANYGYNVKLLTSTGKNIVDIGLNTVHNDTCYPALLVVGQFIDAIESGEYDKDKVAVMMPQTGGGCRFSNYICLLRKALQNRGYGQIPVLSFSFGVDKEFSIKVEPPMVFDLLYSVLIGDFIMILYNQCKPYEKNEGAADNAREAAFNTAKNLFVKGKILSNSKVKSSYRAILEEFKKVERTPAEKKKVGVVGEIYIKHSPLGNNELEKFLMAEGCEVVVPGFLGYFLYGFKNFHTEAELGRASFAARLYGVLYRYLLTRQKDAIKIIEKHSDFTPPQYFDDTYKLVQNYITHGVKMGEGWLLTAEMVELTHSGVNNIVCAQPFGCLPNHIAGKGMQRKIKEKNPDSNIVVIDYDPGATKVNQENRIKLMLSVAEGSISHKSV
jgi:predicted nucleotide-binding protein (sugar kinase/HSP70/actin superfamily)